MRAEPIIHPDDPDLSVDSQGRLRWHRPDTPPEQETSNYLTLQWQSFIWVKPVRPGLAVLAASDGIYVAKWSPSRFEDTMQIQKVYQ